MAATTAPRREDITRVSHQKWMPSILATRVASRLWLGRLLKSAIPVHNKAMAKNGCQKDTFAVLPINPQVAKEMITITHQGKTSCNKKEAISITRKTICYFEIVKCEITFPFLSSAEDIR